MFQKLANTFFLIFLIVLLVAGLWALTAYFDHLPAHLSQHETLIFGQNRLVPGSQAALRVVVRDSKDASPIRDAQISVSMRPGNGGQSLPLYEGSTDRLGTANVSFKVPLDAGPDQNLVIQTRSPLGSDTVERPVSLEREYRLLLATDKPLYQPGQVIHVRILALGAFDLRPAAGQELELVIADGKGNKVFRKKLAASDFGVASADFQLAGEVNTGPYKISATLADTTSEKTVTVERYVLPKFSVDLSVERPYYRPGEHVKGTLKAGYFYGKPVSGGEVKLEGYTFDVERSLAIDLQGTTTESGDFTFEFDLPAYIAGSDLEGGQARFYLQASVTDLARHTETSNLSLPVAQNTLVIKAIPEAGQFRPGVDNILYVLTSYPDGSPAETSLNLSFSDGSQPITQKTGSYGLAEVHLTPLGPAQQVTIRAEDVQGHSVQSDFYFEGEYAEEAVLLRPDRPVYQVGETCNLLVLTSNPRGVVYLDVVRQGQTVSTRSLEVEDGRAEATLDLTPDLYGVLELHAYKVLPSGTIIRDTRMIVVDNAAGLDLHIQPGQESYRPGENASLDIQVNGADGAGVQSALGLAVVDESVFALAEQDPGFARLYFLLEQELLQPKYDLHGFSVPDLVRGLPGDDPALLSAVEDTAQASLAAAAPRAASFSLQANSHADAIQRASQRQQRFFTGLSKGLYGALIALPLVVFALALLAGWRERRLAQILAVFFALVLAAVLLFFLAPLGENYAWAQSPLDRLGILLGWFSAPDQGALVLLLLAALGAYLVLIISAWRQQDRALGASLLLLPLALVLLGFLVFAAIRASLQPGERTLVLGLAAFSLLPLAFLLHFARFVSGRRLVPGLASLLIALFLVGGALPILAFSSRTLAFTSAANRELLAGGPALMKGEIPPMAALAPMPTQAAAMDMVEEPAQENGATASQAPEPPRLRQYFPETMLWLPDATTGPDGALHLDLPVADSITTWRITALASSQDGRLGSATAGLRVFQDFFIDLDLPQALTAGDEVSVPVGVFNYLPEAQDVRLELEQAGWFELLDEPVKQVSIAANDIGVVYFRVRAVQFGKQSLKVTATGSQMSDAIQKEVQVYPDGKQITFTHSDRLSPDHPVQQEVEIPAGAIPGTQSLVVKIYPGIMSQVVEGLDSILRMPYGCFEQTSSTTYPNVLVMDYLKTTNQVSPETQFKAEEYINLGYQRLTTFEVQSSGGFSLFGDPPADRMLTAYGLQEFGDMSRVHDVDPALIQRAAEWLLSQQTGDGSWENDQGLVHENTWSSLGNDRLPVTAYITWSLVEAGFGDDPRTQKGLQYVREFQGQAEDPYVAALVANALLAADPKTGGQLSPVTLTVLDRLAGLAQQGGNAVFWKSGIATFMGSEGQTGSIETTALAALAFLRAGSHPDLANAALTYLIQQKDSSGAWYTTQATVLALKSLIQSVRAGTENANATVTVSLNGGQARTVQVTPENFDVVQLLSFEDLNPGSKNVISIQVEGEGDLMYQISGSYYYPWEKLPELRSQHPEALGEEDLVTIGVAYDRTELAVNDTVDVQVTVTLNQPGKADSALIDLGLPPGFSVQTEDLDALVARFDDVPEDYALPTIQRYELTGRQILVYVSNLSSDHPLQFSYRLKAKFPLVAQAPASSAYDYYNPQVSGEILPQTLMVLP